ncbi:hypothetical protein QDW16_gp04 [Microbacterium phage Quenya]|uniref:hypothetical protein n=1 Tax=Microbacterium phage Quenya TaxID=2776868 RepID=UPI0018A54F1D|nr:hypothetical protein QDW16_gp04 [Microbacterium phage Quenya]QOP64300.1 hypothetical protein SEA_QUENYA_65 [Microbacterium phage Quenya]
MAQPKFTVYSAAGEPIAGDDRADGHIKIIAQNHLGYVADRAGNVVFDARAEVTAPQTEDPAVAAPTDNTKENEQ